MNRKLLIDKDLEVQVTGLLQWPVYEGMMEGYPAKERNSRLLLEILEKAKKFCRCEEVFLIEPVQTPYPYHGELAAGEPVALPSIVCVASLFYNHAVRDLTKDMSGLGLVWLQNDYAFPIDKEVKKKIRNFPYRELCREGDF